jgi:hypothetical protein
LVGMARDLAEAGRNTVRTGIGVELRTLHSDLLRKEIPDRMATHSVAQPWRPRLCLRDRDHESDRGVTDSLVHRPRDPTGPRAPTAPCVPWASYRARLASRPALPQHPIDLGVPICPMGPGLQRPRMGPDRPMASWDPRAGRGLRGARSTSEATTELFKVDPGATPQQFEPEYLMKSVACGPPFSKWWPPVF